MIWFGIAIVALLVSIVVIANRSYREDGVEQKIPIFLPVIGFFIAFTFFIFSVVRVVPANSVGIPVTFGSVGGELSPGLKIVSPFTSIRTFSTRLQELSMQDKDNGEAGDAITVRGSDGYEMRVAVTVRYKVLQESAVPLFRRVGSMDGIRDRIVKPEVSEAIRIVFADYTAEDGYSLKRTEVSADANEIIRARLAPYGLELDAVLIRNVDPNQNLKTAIDERSAARERALQAKLEQEKQVTEAETRKQVAERDAAAAITAADGQAKARVIGATAEADANKLITASLSVLLNDYIRAQALSSAETIYIPSDSSLLIGR